MNRSPLSRRRPRLLRLPWLATAPPSPLPTASPIHQLLLDCLSRVTDPAPIARLAQLSATDWRELVQVSARHGVGPLLYDRLSTGASLLPVPDGVMQTLREAFLMNATRNALLYHDLAQAVTTLQQNGIRVAVLKGAHLAALIYPHIGLRPMADMDLLVPKEDLAKADTVLCGLGYATNRWQDIETQCRASQHLVPFSKPPHPRIELHWTLAAPTLPFQIDMAGILVRLRPATIAGVETHVLAPDDLLLHLCTHAAGHLPVPFCHGFRTFCDLAAVLRHHRAELDWAAIKGRAVGWRAGKGVYVALRLACELVQAEVPPTALEALRPDNFDGQGYALACEQASFIEAEPTGTGNELDWPRFRVLVQGTTTVSFAGKLKFLVRTAFPSREHMTIYMAQFHSLPLTGHRRYTCYLTRALDLTGRCLRLLRYGATHRQETDACARQLQREAELRRWLIGPNSP